MNLLIDYLAQFLISMVLGIVIVFVGGRQGVEFLERTPDILVGLPILLTYYIVFEGMTSRTLGKLVTRTKVVNENGGVPTVGQFVGRAFCRLIPFEAFTFFGSPPRGLHDRLPKTYVVKVR